MGRMRQRALRIRKHERSLARREWANREEADERGSEYEGDDLQASFLIIFAWADDILLSDESS